jgi:hypothetical protein
MRIFPISDLHLERRSLPLPEMPQNFDVIAFAGDGYEGDPAKTVEVIAQLARGRTAVIVPGNHDLYRRDRSDRRTLEDLLEAMREAAMRINDDADADLVHVLDAGRAVEIGGAIFIGATLWGDWAIAGHWLPDYHLARLSWTARRQATKLRTAPREYAGSIVARSGCWSPENAIAAHAVDRVRITDALIEAGKRPTVVVTHAPPLAEAVDAYRTASVPWWTPGFYVSDFLRDLPSEFQPNIWIAGHVHRALDTTFGRTRFVMNPLESAHFQADLILDLEVPEATSWRRRKLSPL